MAEDGGAATRRDQRAQRVREQSRKQMPKKAAKFIGVTVVVVALLVGVVWAFNAFGPVDPIHWHAGFQMFVDEENINFDHAAFDLSQTGYMRAHLHVPSSPGAAKNVLHVEGAPGVSMGRFFESLKVQTSNDRVELHESVHGGRVVSNNETHAWQVWVDECADGPDQWEKAGRLFGHQPQQHDRILVIFAPSNATAESLAPQMSQVPTDAQLTQAANDQCEGGPPSGTLQAGMAMDTGFRTLDWGRIRTA